MKYVKKKHFNLIDQGYVLRHCKPALLPQVIHAAGHARF